MTTPHPMAEMIAGTVRTLCGSIPRWLCEPRPRQRIYFANHSSHLDFVLIWASMPPPVRHVTRPVAALDYWKTGRVRPFLANRVFNAVLIDRQGRKADGAPVRNVTDDLLDALGDRHSLILFPEGTRNTGEDLLPFKSGLYHLHATRPDIELVPVYLENLNRILPKGEVIPAPLVASVTFGEPLPGVGAGESKTEFLDRARNAIRALRDDE